MFVQFMFTRYVIGTVYKLQQKVIKFHRLEFQSCIYSYQRFSLDEEHLNSTEAVINKQ